jgi:hypothetical protein
MRRSTRLGLLIGSLLLIILCGGYTAIWFVAAGRVADGVGPWVQSLHAQNLDLTWQFLHVRGFPFAFRVDLTRVQLRSGKATMPGDVQVPLLSASVSPWNLHLVRLAAPGGIVAATGPADVPTTRLSARSAEGSAVVGETEGANLWFGIDEPVVDASLHVAARKAFLWVLLPAHPPQTHTDPAVGLALDIWDLSLPLVPAPLRNPLDEIGLGITVRGQVPNAPPRQAAAAWRDAGGTVELDHGTVRWGALAIHAAGTAALDADLQPTAALSGGVAGYPELMRALVAAGRIRRSDAGIADMALSFLARAGPDGRPEIGTSFTIQDGQMFLGPAKLGPAPRLSW